ncbi:MAG: nitroreductase family protein, partial [Chloroflexi bacterium]|nr:nitroreductase family protein [Chloroflexota bacterium]
MVESSTLAGLTAEIVERRSVVAFDSRPIEAEKLQALIEAARWAPSSSNRQPWRITMVRDGASRDGLNAALAGGNRTWAPNAPLLVVFATAAPDPERPGQLAKLMLDVGFAGQNMMLEAVHQGLRVHPMAGWDEDKVKAALDIPGENPVTSQCPPVIPNGLREGTTRGPTTSPRSMACLSDTVTSPPKSRTVVNPASSVIRAYFVALN